MSLNSKSQLIFDDYSFNADVRQDIARWDGFSTSGVDYHFVGILGPQSSGKSTLLNLLFNCSYDVMDEKTGRGQTTRGMWISYDPSKKVVVMDVEGTDSVERGETHVNFERKSSLFSLAMSEVLIINNNYLDVGRYSASNYDTLKTIFDVHLRLFHSPGSPKTKLLFILRDAPQSFIMEKVAVDLRENIQRLWDDIEMPAEIEKNTIDSYFDLEFIGLPHYKYESAAFHESANVLSRRFADPTSDQYVFEDRYKKQVPAEGFTDFAESIWDKIIHNRDLDLPSLKEMLASMRCSEIYKEVYQPVQRICDAYTVDLQAKKILPKLSESFQYECDASLCAFKERASLYQKSVYEKKYAELQEDLARLFAPLKLMQLENIATKIFKDVSLSANKHISSLMEAMDKDFWASASKSLQGLLTGSHINQLHMDLQASLLDPSPAAVAAESQRLIDELRPQLIELVKTKVSDPQLILRSMKQAFDRIFKYDQSGIPRVWDSAANVNEEFARAREAAYEILNLFSEGDLDMSEDGNNTLVSIKVLDEPERTQIKTKFDNEAYHMHQEAAQSQKKNLSLASLPPYVYLVIAVLGFNELLGFLRWIISPMNAILFIFVLIFGFFLYQLHQVGLLAPAQAVLYSQARLYYTELISHLHNLLDDTIAPSPSTSATKKKTD